ncbi:hypothetical protein DsansV1_C16g0139021 [Dioscorea sansibarensis]
MEFRKYPQGTWYPPGDTIADMEGVNFIGKAIFLLLMSGEGRYAWHHYTPHHKKAIFLPPDRCFLCLEKVDMLGTNIFHIIRLMLSRDSLSKDLQEGFYSLFARRGKDLVGVNLTNVVITQRIKCIKELPTIGNFSMLLIWPFLSFN